MRRAIALLWVPVLCLAQFSNLATTSTGDRVFFVTPLRQPGQNQVPHEKLFRLDSPSTLSLVFQREETGGPILQGGSAPGNITVSADGRYVAFTTVKGCVGYSSCWMRELSSGSVLDVYSGESVFDGALVRVSRNGRYVLSQPTASASGAVPQPTITVLDRTTNESHSIETGSVITVTSRGDVLVYASGMQLVPWSGSARTLPVTGVQAVDDSLTTIIYGNGYDSLDQRRLFVYDIASGRQWQLGPDGRPSYRPALSDDGQWVLYLTDLGGMPELMLSHPDGTNWKQLTVESSGISEGVLSGDGRVASASTKDGRLLRIATDTLDTQEVLAPPVLTGSSWSVVPGSLLRLSGYRLSTNVHIGDTAVSAIAAAGTEVDVQVPWDLPQPAPTTYGTSYVTISFTRDGSPLEAVTADYAATWSTYMPQGWMGAIHQDWKALVSAGNPARPGEILHIYATGLGPTTCTVANLQPAPIGELCTPARTIEWTWWWNNSMDAILADVPFAGFAPGLIGLYQIDARVPEYPPAASLTLIADRMTWSIVASVPVSQ